MQTNRYEWDEEKNDINIQKHGVSFEEAESVFDDPFALYSFDAEHSYDFNEERFKIIGHSNKLKLLVVCHCYKDNDDVIRIFSARKATNNEKRLYGGAL